jgi:hypothetical protein
MAGFRHFMMQKTTVGTPGSWKSLIQMVSASCEQAQLQAAGLDG